MPRARLMARERRGRVGRRELLAAAVVAAGGAAAVAMTRSRRIGGPGNSGRPVPDQAEDGRLQPPPRPATGAPPQPGVHRLGLATGRDGLLRVPVGYRLGTAAPLVVALHGAGGDAEGGMAPWHDVADVATAMRSTREFDGAHTIPADQVTAAAAWLLGP